MPSSENPLLPTGIKRNKIIEVPVKAIKSGFSAWMIRFKNRVVLRSEQNSNSEGSTSLQRVRPPLPKCISATFARTWWTVKRTGFTLFYTHKEKEIEKPGGSWRYRQKRTGGEDWGSSWCEPFRCQGRSVVGSFAWGEELQGGRRGRAERVSSFLNPLPFNPSLSPGVHWSLMPATTIFVPMSTPSWASLLGLCMGRVWGPNIAAWPTCFL